MGQLLRMSDGTVEGYIFLKQYSSERGQSFWGDQNVLVNRRTPDRLWPLCPSPWCRSVLDLIRGERRWDWHLPACQEGGLSSSPPTQRAGWAAGLHLLLKAATKTDTQELLVMKMTVTSGKYLRKQIRQPLQNQRSGWTHNHIHMRTHMHNSVCI